MLPPSRGHLSVSWNSVWNSRVLLDAAKCPAVLRTVPCKELSRPKCEWCRGGETPFLTSSCSLGLEVSLPMKRELWRVWNILGQQILRGMITSFNILNLDYSQICWFMLLVSSALSANIKHFEKKHVFVCGSVSRWASPSHPGLNFLSPGFGLLLWFHLKNMFVFATVKLMASCFLFSVSSMAS